MKRIIRTLKSIEDITLKDIAEHCERSSCKKCDLENVCAILKHAHAGYLNDIDMEETVGIYLAYEE